MRPDRPYFGRFYRRGRKTHYRVGIISYIIEFAPMKPFDLAKLFLATHRDQRDELIRRHQPLPAVEIAESLQRLCYEVWTDDPQKVSAIADTLNDLAERTRDAEVRGYAEWTAAIEALVEGELETCIYRLGESERTFEQ